jgi:cytochrome c oxidase cbb3-type subunit III
MLNRRERALYTSGNRIVAVTGALLMTVSVYGLGVQEKTARSTRVATPEQSFADGRQFFENRCAGCHGIDGRGGERGPDIATDSKVQRHSDSALTQIIHNGIPSAGMPAFSTVDATTTRALVKYLRFLQGKTGSAALPGNPQNGKKIFFGSARCSECHLAGGAGGFIAPDLSSYGRRRRVEEIRDAIIMTRQEPNAKRGTISVTTRNGQSITGVVRNEDNFSLQLQSLDGAFHLIMKSDVVNVKRDPNSLMPADYGSTLSLGDLNDLVSFLMSMAGQDKSGTDPNKKGESGAEDE